MHSLRWAWSYIRTYRTRLIMGLTLALVVSALNMINPYLAGKIVDKVIYGHQDNLLWKFLFVMIGFTFIRTVVRYGYQMMFEKLAQNVIYTMRKDLYDQLQRLDFSFYDQTKTGDLMARMT